MPRLKFQGITPDRVSVIGTQVIRHKSVNCTGRAIETNSVAGYQLLRKHWRCPPIGAGNFASLANPLVVCPLAASRGAMGARPTGRWLTNPSSAGATARKTFSHVSSLAFRNTVSVTKRQEFRSSYSTKISRIAEQTCSNGDARNDQPDEAQQLAR